jgi:hypothetical protein
VERHFLHRFARSFGRFPDRFGDFVRFAETDADLPIVIARDNQRTKAETPAAFYDLGATVDEDDLLGRIAPRR